MNLVQLTLTVLPSLVGLPVSWMLMWLTANRELTRLPMLVTVALWGPALFWHATIAAIVVVCVRGFQTEPSAGAMIFFIFLLPVVAVLFSFVLQVPAWLAPRVKPGSSSRRPFATVDLYRTWVGRGLVLSSTVLGTWFAFVTDLGHP